MSKVFGFVLQGAAVAALCFIAYGFGRNRSKCEIICQTDTVTVVMEKVCYKPKETASIVYATNLVPLLLARTDTVVVARVDSVTATLPVEHKTYTGDDYECEVSGYTPKLEWIKTFAKTQTVTRTVKRKFNVGIQLGVGLQYGVFRRSVDVGPYGGVGVEWNF